MKLVSFRRYYLDKCLSNVLPCMKGDILDIGGVRINKRGYFRVPENLAPQWKYLNMNPSTGADIVASVPPIPIPDASFDTVLLIEVLEYIFNPENLIREISRITRKDGCLILSVPFNHPLHGDFQSDYYRFTESGILKLIEDSFHIETFDRMGGPAAVVADIYLNIFKVRNRFLDKLIVKCINYTAPLILFFDKANKNANTGFFIVARRK